MVKIVQGLFIVLVFTLFFLSISDTRKSAYLKGKEDGKLETCNNMILIAPILRVISKGCFIKEGKLFLDLKDNDSINLDELFDENE